MFLPRSQMPKEPGRAVINFTQMERSAAPAFSSFGDFYPFYLSQHSDRTCRRLHFVGTSLGVAASLHAFATLEFGWMVAGIATGYAFAWVGHFFFEKNRPATFTYPLYSFMGDWVMWKDILTRKIAF